MRCSWEGMILNLEETLWLFFSDEHGVDAYRGVVSKDENTHVRYQKASSLLLMQK